VVKWWQVLRQSILQSEYYKELAEVRSFAEIVDEIYNKVS
jgi:hypothetical protein